MMFFFLPSSAMPDRKKRGSTKTLPKPYEPWHPGRNMGIIFQKGWSSPHHIGVNIPIIINQ